MTETLDVVLECGCTIDKITSMGIFVDDEDHFRCPTHNAFYKEKK